MYGTLLHDRVIDAIRMHCVIDGDSCRAGTSPGRLFEKQSSRGWPSPSSCECRIARPGVEEAESYLNTL